MFFFHGHRVNLTRIKAISLYVLDCFEPAYPWLTRGDTESTVSHITHHVCSKGRHVISKRPTPMNIFPELGIIAGTSAKGSMLPSLASSVITTCRRPPVQQAAARAAFSNLMARQGKRAIHTIIAFVTQGLPSPEAGFESLPRQQTNMATARKTNFIKQADSQVEQSEPMTTTPR